MNGRQGIRGKRTVRHEVVLLIGVWVGADYCRHERRLGIIGDSAGYDTG
jgi:hypothetical protein